MKTRGTERSPDYRIEQARGLIDGAPAKNWTVDDLAAACDLSRFHFSRLFTAATGRSVPAYRLERRIELAKRSLLATRAPIKEVAAQCGFCNVSHFERAFKAIETTTPRQFRIACLSKAAVG